MAKRKGIFGGSFDPIHLGHLIMAEMFRESMALDSVLFIPTHVSPFKVQSLPTQDKHRIEMLRLAIGGHSQFDWDDREIRKGGVSYTIDTVRALQEEQSDTQWSLLIGEDSLRDFDRWREPKELLERVQLVVVHRGGFDAVSWSAIESIATEAQLAAIRSRRVEAPSIEIASSDIRRRVREGRSIRYLVPAAVEAYVYEHGLWSREPERLTASDDTN